MLKPIKTPNLLRLGRKCDGGYIVNLDVIKNGLPIILEITFLKTKYVREEKTEYIKEFPIDGLDYPCNSYKDDLTFRFE